MFLDVRKGYKVPYEVKDVLEDDETGKITYKEVEWLFQREVEETYNITVGSEVITTTDEHPFWIVEKCWVKAKDLVVGDVLTTSKGKELAIDKIEVKKEHNTVYNFKVKDFHTYFVSNLGIWTHNSCGYDSSKGKGKVSAKDIVFSDKFKKPGYKNQVSERGWTNESIAKTINNPYKTDKSTNKYTGNSVTVYFKNKTHYVAVDDGTRKVIQVSDLNKADWKFDPTFNK